MTEEELRRKIFDIGPASVQEIKEALKKHILALAPSGDINAPNLPPLDYFRRLGLSIRTAKKLIKENIHSIEELTAKTEEELLNLFDIGPVSIQEIKEVLKKNDLTLFPDNSFRTITWVPSSNLHLDLPTYGTNSHNPGVDAQSAKK